MMNLWATEVLLQDTGETDAAQIYDQDVEGGVSRSLYYLIFGVHGIEPAKVVVMPKAGFPEIIL
jgi:hypothetical protein